MANPKVFFDVTIGGRAAGRIEFEVRRICCQRPRLARAEARRVPQCVRTRLRPRLRVTHGQRKHEQ
jgi:hypothetical protein